MNYQRVSGISESFEKGNVSGLTSSKEYSVKAVAPFLARSMLRPGVPVWVVFVICRAFEFSKPIFGLLQSGPTLPGELT